MKLEELTTAEWVAISTLIAALTAADWAINALLR